MWELCCLQPLQLLCKLRSLLLLCVRRVRACEGSLLLRQMCVCECCLLLLRVGRVRLCEHSLLLRVGRVRVFEGLLSGLREGLLSCWM